MKTNILQLFLIVLISASVISCNNQGTRNNQGDYGDSLEVNDNNNTGVFGNDENRDREFLEEAAYGGLYEVELAKYVQQNAQNQRVRNFASMMVKDHSKANDELKALAAQKNVTVPTALDEDHLKKVNNMREKRGADLDREYMKEMVDDHEKDVDKYKKQAEQGNDSDIKAFAAKTLPILLMHQDSAKKIRDYLK